MNPGWADDIEHYNSFPEVKESGPELFYDDGSQEDYKSKT